MNKRRQRSLKTKSEYAPKIGFGSFGLPTENMESIITTAIEVGYRLFDTASEYKNEEELGRAISNCIGNKQVRREDLFIQTKYYPSSPFDEKTVEIQFYNSLKKLNVDYLDSYLVHKPIPWHSELSYRQDNKKIWSALKRFRREGLIRYIGVSNFMERHIDFLDEEEDAPEINQLEIHPLFQQKGLCDWCVEKGIVVQAWSPLARGRALENVKIRSLSEKYNKTPAQICLNWESHNGYIPITSAENQKWIKEGFDSLEFEMEESDYFSFIEINTYDGHQDLWMYKRNLMY